MVSRPFPSNCNESRLKAFLDDDLPESEHTPLVHHLDSCASCRRTLERLAAGSRLWAELRQLAPGRGSFPSDTDFVVERHGPRTEREIPLDFLAPSSDPESLGQLGPYEITEVLGRGGFGIVLKAFDPALGRAVAIKVLAPHLATTGAARSRFAREARAAAAVVHENVVAIHSVDSWNGLPYLVMPFVAGRSLQERVDRDGPLEVKEMLRIGMQTALGLAAAHAQGLVHRDVKPSNILLENGVERVKLSDFGLARAVDDASLTQSGVVTGTPQYMSPEQARGDAVDHRSDLFGLGSVLYFMGAGHPPFRADSTPAVLRRVSDDRPRPLNQVNPDIPSWLAKIVERLHAKEPSGRFQSAMDVAEVLKHHLAELQRSGTPAASRASAPLPSRKSLGRKAAVAILLASGAVFALAATGSPHWLHAVLPPGGILSQGANQAGGDGGGQVAFLAPGEKPSNTTIVGSGRAASKVWDVADFTVVKIGSTFRAEIVQGNSFKVTTSSDDNVVEYIQVVKQDKTLKIGLEPNKHFRLEEPLKVEIVLPTLEGLETGGASKVTLKGIRSEGDFKLKLSGASTLDGTLDVGNMDAQVSGASTVALNGSAKATRIAASGASRLKLPEFLLKACAIELTGASNARVTVRSDQPFRASISGASRLDGTVEVKDLELMLGGASHATLRGTAKDTKIKVDGASSVDLTKLSVDAKKVSLWATSTSSVALHGKTDDASLMASGTSHLQLAGLTVNDADVILSGLSHATIDVRNRLNYILSSNSHLDYVGNPPTVTGKKSEGATLRRRP